MGLASDLKVLYHVAVKPIRGNSHADRLESFYSGQAEAYDDFRRRLLAGREAMYQAIDPPEDAVWIDMGGGTGANLECLGDRLADIGKVYLVDLSSSLLKVARGRIEERGWQNVEAVEADATRFRPSEGTADVVTFSYSLTMIPDWFAALENACALLKPGGQIGVVDFFVSRKYPADDLKRHSWLTRTFWPMWFMQDNVFLSPDHVPYLHRRFEKIDFADARNRVPYVPLMRVPYYRFIGRKPL